MILIFGDSWGCGEWNPSAINSSLISHPGLVQYIRDSGRPAINLSQPGASPNQILSIIETFFQSGCTEYLPEPVTQMLVFQTEYVRDYYAYKDENTHYTKLIEKWYSVLSSFSMKYSVKIGVIGGCSDVLWTDNFEQKFTGVYIACQSFCNLLVNGQDQIDSPVFFIRPNDNIISNNFICASIKEMVQILDQTSKRWTLLKENPQWFFPDGSHPNRYGHKELFEFLNYKGYLA